MRRPDASEFAPYYAPYVDPVPGDDVLPVLREQLEDTSALLASIDEERSRHRYEPEKWSIREVVGHVVDTERAFGYRAVAFARADAAPIPGLDQDDWVRAAGFENRTLASLARELRALREANIELFGSLAEDAASRIGTASGVAFTARSLAWIIAGHERHHMRVLRERYL